MTESWRIWKSADDPAEIPAEMDTQGHPVMAIRPFHRG